MTAQRIGDVLIISGESIGHLHTLLKIAVTYRNRQGIRTSSIEHHLMELTAPRQIDTTPEPAEHNRGHLTDLCPKQVANMLDCSPRTVLRKAQQLGGRKIGGRWVFDQLAVQAHLEGKHLE